MSEWFTHFAQQTLLWEFLAAAAIHFTVFSTIDWIQEQRPTHTRRFYIWGSIFTGLHIFAWVLYVLQVKEVWGDVEIIDWIIWPFLTYSELVTAWGEWYWYPVVPMKITGWILLLVFMVDPNLIGLDQKKSMRSWITSLWCVFWAVWGTIWWMFGYPNLDQGLEFLRDFWEQAPSMTVWFFILGTCLTLMATQVVFFIIHKIWLANLHNLFHKLSHEEEQARRAPWMTSALKAEIEKDEQQSDAIEAWLKSGQEGPAPLVPKTRFIRRIRRKYSNHW